MNAKLPALLEGALYGFDNVGSAGPISHLTCINAATGERNWQELRFGKGNLIAADGKLFLSTMKGELVVVNANPKKFEELGRKIVVGKTRQAPALAGGLIYLRDDHEIVCLDVHQSQQRISAVKSSPIADLHHFVRRFVERHFHHRRRRSDLLAKRVRHCHVSGDWRLGSPG